VKAYRLHDFTGLDDLKLREEDTPHPQQGEVLVRVHAVSLNFRDIAMLRDRYPLPHRKGLIPTSEVLNYNEEPQWGNRARALTGGRGVDRVAEVGGGGTIGESLHAVAASGELASIGFLCAGSSNIDFFALFGSGARIRHISVGSREDLQDVARAIAMARIKPMIDRVFDFEDAREAFAHLESGSHFGKVVVRCAK
jgi:NADPH:quinone reductase-like Zn-dependent oxidoreductase